jgi:hypothetical protein
VPAGLIDQEDGVGFRRDSFGDFRQEQVRGLVLQAGRIRAAALPSCGQTAPKM